MKGNILLLLDRYLPEPLSSAVMFNDLAREFNNRGFKVTIIAGSHKIKSNCEISIENEIKVVRVRTKKLRTNYFQRTINELFLGRRIWVFTKDKLDYSNFDLVAYYSPTIFWSSLVNRLRTKYNITSYLVLRDIFPKWAADLGLIRRYGIVYFFFKIFEYKLYRSANYIGVQSPNNQLYFESSRYLDSFNTEVLYNWTSIDTNEKNYSLIRQELNLEDKIIFLYGGNIGVAQDIDNLLDLAKMLLERKEIVFLLVGDGTESKRLDGRIKNENIINTILLPSVTPEAFQGIVSESDVGLISLSRDLKTENYPGKIMSYMKSKKPMLASINDGNELFNMIHNNSGYVALNGDHNLLLKYAIKMANNKSQREEMGMNGFRLLKNQFNVDSAVDKILDKITYKD